MQGSRQQMSDQPQGIDPYDAVLADLKAKRDQIDHAILVLEGLRGGVSLPGLVQPQTGPDADVDGPGAFLGMTIPDAAKKLLNARKRALGNADIVAAFKAGGLEMRSVDPLNTIGSVLTRRFNTVGDIVRVGRGVWGLAEWYPNRNFRKKGAPKGDNEAGAATPESGSSVTSGNGQL